MPKVGDIVNGSVVQILKAGARIQIESNEVGFLHISEVSKSFVKNVNDFLKVGDAVTVRIMNIIPAENRMYLSIRAVDEEEYQKDKNKPAPKPSTKKPQTYKKKEEDPASVFEKRMSRFLKDSQDKIKTLQRNRDRKQGVRKKPKQK